MLRKENQNERLPLRKSMAHTEWKIRKEIAIMKKLDHPHIVKLIDVIDDDKRKIVYMGALTRSAVRHTARSHGRISDGVLRRRGTEMANSFEYTFTAGVQRQINMSRRHFRPGLS